MIPVEVVGKRTENTKTFKLRGSKFRKVVSSEPLHFMAESGWKEIAPSYYTAPDGSNQYDNLPYKLAINGNLVEIEGKNDEYKIVIESAPREVTYKVVNTQIKTFLEMPNRESVPEKIQIKVKYTGIDADITGDSITIGNWSIRKPIVYDSLNQFLTPDSSITSPREGEIILEYTIPVSWLNENRVYPIVFDPTYTSSETTIITGGHTDHTTESTIVIHDVYCRWRGSSDWATTQGYTYAATVSTATTDSCINTTMPNLTGAQVSLGATSAVWGHIHGSYTQDCWFQVMVSGCAYYIDMSETINCAPGAVHGAATTLDPYYFGIVKGARIYPVDYSYVGGETNFTATLAWQLTVETKTQSPTATSNGKTCTYSDSVNHDTLTSYQKAQAGFIIEGDNVINHTISGSGDAGFQFYYDYSVFYPPTDWTAYGIPDDISKYERFTYGYATTLSSSDLDYGTGSIVLEFSTNLGVTAPATTWVINYDIFGVDLHTDAARIGTIIQSRGTKVSGGTMYSMMSDWATYLTLDATIDNFLSCDILAGSSTVYTLTPFTASIVDISPYTGRREFKGVYNAGSVATSYFITLTSTLSNPHYMFEEILLFATNFTISGAEADVTSWFDTMVTLYGAPATTGVLDPIWPIRLNSEVMYAESIPASGATYLTFKHSSTPTRGKFDICYSHNHGERAYCVPTIGLYTNSTSIFNDYGAAERFVSPIEIVDGHTLDTLCWNGLLNSTNIIDWGKGKILGPDLPASIDVGDWVNLQNVHEDWYSNNYEYRQEFLVTNASVAATYSKLFNVFRSTDTSTATYIYVGTMCASSYNDMRFTTSNGTTLIDYMIDSSDEDVATIYVKFDLSATCSATFFIYYGYDDETAYSTSFATSDDAEVTIDEWLTEETYKEGSITPYRIVGLEFDQKTSAFVLEFGGVEDYYLSNDQRYKDTVDLTQSNV